MLNFPRSVLIRILLAALIVGAATFVSIQIELVQAPMPHALFFAAVAMVSWSWGSRLGIFTLIAAALSFNYFATPPAYSFTLTSGAFVEAGIFSLVSLLIIWLMEALRRRTAAMSESETRFGFVFDGSPVPTWIVDPQTGRFLAVNCGATSYYGYTRAEFSEITLEDLGLAGTEPLNKMLEVEPEGALPIYQFARRDGTVLYIETIARDLIFDGRPGKLIHTVDVTERILASAAIQASEARLNRIFGNCPVALSVQRRSDWTFLDANDEFSRLSGWDREQLLGRTPVELGMASATDMGRLHDYFQSESTLINEEVEITTRGGEKRTILLGGVAVDIQSETSVITTFVDVTERHQAEEKRRVSDERLRLVTENARVGLVMIDERRRYTFANPSFAEMFELSARSIVGQSVEAVHPTLFENQISTKLELAFSGESVKFELRRPCADGDRFYEISYQPTSRNGTIYSVVAIVTEITERARAELARQAVEERYRTLFEYDPDGLLIANKDSNYVDANDSICRLLGYERSEIIGLHATDIIVPMEVQHLNETVRGLNTDLEYFYEWQFRRRDGSIFRAEVNSTTMPDGNTLIVVRDITDRILLEDQLLQAQKMEAIAVLTGGVAHDFNNILTAIACYSDLSLESLDEGDPLRAYVTEIKEAGIRATALTNQLLAFCRKKVLSPTVHNLNSTITETEKMLRRIVKENIEFDISLDPELGNIKADMGQIEQVLVNLVVNAGDAMPDGGRLRIQTRNTYIDHSYDDFVAVPPGRFAEVLVSDTGEGMDLQTKNRLFEPFFTTKEVGKGTGLGLSTVFGIVKQSGGDIVVESELGRGATFKVYFPIVDEAVPLTAPTREADVLVGNGAETILLVEDEFAVRNLVKNILVGRNYTVLEADNGSSALEICKTYQDTIHVLLTDVILPRMGGNEIYTEILKLRPTIKTLFMSGYSGEALDEKGILPTGVAFVEKPFTPTTLVGKIREVLRVDTEASSTRGTSDQDTELSVAAFIN